MAFGLCGHQTQWTEGKKAVEEGWALNGGTQVNQKEPLSKERQRQRKRCIEVGRKGLKGILGEVVFFRDARRDAPHFIPSNPSLFYWKAPSFVREIYTVAIHLLSLLNLFLGISQHSMALCAL